MHARYQHRSDPRSERTRHVLIEAAIDLMGRYGFDHVTIRQIADAAAVNLAAVNYHFRSKAGLREAAMEAVVSKMREEGASSRLAALDADIIDQLTPAKARSILRDVMLAGVRASCAQPEKAAMRAFIQRELFQPGPISKRFYNRVFADDLKLTARLVARITGDAPDSEAVRLKALTLVGQSVFLSMAQTVVHYTMGWQHSGEDQLEAIADAFWLYPAQ